MQIAAATSEQLVRRTDAPLSPLAERIRKNLFPILWHPRKGGFPPSPTEGLFNTNRPSHVQIHSQSTDERSTWLGLLALATACGATIEQALADQIIAAGMAAAGLIGIVTKDRKKEQENHDNG